MKASEDKAFSFFTKGKPAYSLMLLDHFVMQFEALGDISLHATKTMIAVSNGDKRIAWITQIGKNFIHIVFPFKQAYKDNLCFQKIGEVPGNTKQVNHHFRMLFPEDVNKEVIGFMKLALKS